jgi:hypothetical protein
VSGGEGRGCGTSPRPQHVESLINDVDAYSVIPESRLPEIERKLKEAFDQQQPQIIKDAGVAGSIEYEHLLNARMPALATAGVQSPADGRPMKACRAAGKVDTGDFWS